MSAATVVENDPTPSPLKVALVTRSFWPISGTTELSIADLAVGLAKEDVQVSILTARWERSWPSFFEYQEIPVYRINRANTSPWRSFQYIRNLQRQLDELNPDAIIVFGLGEECWSVAKTFGGKIPFVIRLDHQFLGCQQETPILSSRQLSALRMAERIFVESEWTRDRLIKHPMFQSSNGKTSGLNAGDVEVIPFGIASDVDYRRTPVRKSTCRISISDAHPVLMIEPNQPLVVCGSPLEGDDGVLDLVMAWQTVLKRFRNARLWIVGEGTHSRKVWDKIVEYNLVHSVIMPGSFDEPMDLFHAADVYIHPLRSNMACGFCVRAMAAGLPVVATPTEFSDSLIEHGSNGLLLDHQRSPVELAKAINWVLSDSELQQRLGSQASKSIVDRLRVEDTIQPILRPLVGKTQSSSFASNRVGE